MIKNLRKYILQDINDVAPNTFFDDAEDDTGYPYTVLDLEQIQYADNVKIYALEVNTWTKNDLEQACDIGETILNKLTKYKRLETDMLVQVEPQGIFALMSDTDRTIKRCRQMFDVRVFERGQ